MGGTTFDSLGFTTTVDSLNNVKTDLNSSLNFNSSYVPSKTGYTFEGWYFDKDYTRAATKISAGTVGAVNLYPKWELETYKVTYILPDGTRATVMCEHGKKADLPSELKTSFYEVVKTDIPRDNITEDVRITITVVNIWYVYVIAVAVLIAIIITIIVVKKRRDSRFESLRTTYQSNSSRYSRAKKPSAHNTRRKYYYSRMCSYNWNRCIYEMLYT